MKALIGYTGFVGGNLLKQISFDELYNSKNISDIRGKSFETIICAGAPAVKWYANKHPEEDFNTISSLIENLKQVTCDEFILISTVDVYNSPLNINENTPVDLNTLQAYGKNRLMLEQFVQTNFKNSIIIRLPGLFGEGLKKNIIYDFLHNNNIDQIDSRNIFQFYNLNQLYKDIETCREHSLKVVNFATEPTSVRELISFAFSIDFTNELNNPLVNYDMQTIHNAYFDKNIPYLASKLEVLEDVKNFVEIERGKTL